MAETHWGAVCENEHVKDHKSEFEDLWQARNCDDCGKKIHRKCPNCEAGIPVRRYVRSDGSKTRWKAKNYCYNCGEAYPWGPGRVGQFIHKHMTGSPSESTPRPSGSVLTPGIRQYLSETKYGEEVVRHTRDGDSCYRNSLWFPALSMYIHAIEWAAITFLEAEVDLDIIEKERQGTQYYLAGGQNSIIDELSRAANVDQKTISIINSINRLERRWVAHHKSGDTHRDDVDAIRSRLETLVESLFKPLAAEMMEDTDA